MILKTQNFTNFIPLNLAYFELLNPNLCPNEELAEIQFYSQILKKKINRNASFAGISMISLLLKYHNYNSLVLN